MPALTITPGTPISEYRKCVTFSHYNGDAGRTVLQCPTGSQMTGGGMKNEARKFNNDSGFEESMPFHNGWSCDSGFGAGKHTCYVRCCH
eukprot:TRINITY_DN15999_c0_g1_i2.p1 TRINITY_DN15999_c0_g1~~TRINITY_DN15999_c0_g1_i2.p1  ORF type:complete len:103 (+),score=14.06 TRINITY_DN15999_c0_g1_i2:43-309(+)